MENKYKILILIGVLFFLVFIFLLVTNNITRYTGYMVLNDDKEFKRCLESKDITLFINTENINGVLDEIKTKNYLENIKIFNCKINPQNCMIQGIKTNLAWKINKKIINQDISLSELRQFSECN